MSDESGRYRLCVGIMLLNQSGLVWIGRRADAPGEPEGPGAWWQMPQGGIDKGEDPRSAAMRELFEETGISSAQIIAESGDWIRYDLPANLSGRIWGGHYQGQSMKWFVLRFTGSDDEINITPPEGLAHKAEFDSWRWAPPRELPSVVVPFKREVYAAVLKEFGGLLA